MKTEIVLIEKVMSIIPNKYEAIRVAAKEARRINSLLIHGAGELEEKPTMLAIQRLLDRKIKFEYADEVKDEGLFEEDSE